MKSTFQVEIEVDSAVGASLTVESKRWRDLLRNLICRTAVETSTKTNRYDIGYVNIL